MQAAKRVLMVIVVLAAAAAVVLFAGRTLRPAAKLRSIQVFCGTSMRPAVEEIAAEYQKREGTFVELSYGGCEALFPQIKLMKKGDLFVCHDPFGDKLKAEGLLDRIQPVGYLEPTIIVPKGSKKEIHSLKDLVTQKLRIGTTDPRFATCGEMVEDKLREHGWAESYEKQPNFVLQSRSHGDVATALITGQLDAGIVWNFIACQFNDKVDQVPTGEEFPETRVTTCLLSCSQNRDAAGKFLDLAGSDFGRQVFAHYGYAKAGHG